MLLEGVEGDVEGLEEVALGRRGVGAAGHRRPARPLVVVQHQLLVVGERLPVIRKISNYV